MPADRLNLDSATVLQGIEDPDRREHAKRVFDEAAAELAEHEAREPIASLLTATIRTLERVEVHLAREPAGGGWLVRLGEIVPIRVLVSILVAILTAIGALFGFDLAGDLSAVVEEVEP